MAALVVACALALSCDYFFDTQLAFEESRWELHTAILRGEAPSPYRYRIVVPLLLEGVRQPIDLLTDLPAARTLTYASAVYSFLFLSLFLATLQHWLRRFASDTGALVVSLFVAVLLTVVLNDHYYQPWSLLEGLLFCLGYGMIVDRRYGALVLLIGFASLNRATAVFLVLAAVCASLRARGGSRRDLVPAVGLVVVWLTVTVALRLGLGSAPHFHSLSALWEVNTSPTGLLRAGANVLATVGLLVVLSVVAWKRMPRILQGLLFILPPYLLTVGAFGVWHEVRLWWPLVPLLAAGAAIALDGRIGGDATSADGPVSAPRTSRR